MAGIDLRGWAPIRLYWEGARPMVDWCYLRDVPLTDPFFDHTVHQCFAKPFRLLFRHQTPVAALVSRSGAETPKAPAGFLFHMSRCGSTLASQMLAALPGNVVVSEASVIDAVLRVDGPFARLEDADRIAWLRGILDAIGRLREPRESRLVVKFEAWHTLNLPLLRRAFPDVPWVFLYREPAEVLASLGRAAGGRLLPGAIDPETLGLDPGSVMQMPPEEYHAAVLAKICESAVEQHRPGRARVIDYRELPEAVWSQLTELFGLRCGEDEIRRMRARARFDARVPYTPFSEDANARRPTITEAIRTAADRWVREPHEALLALRRRQGVG